VIIGFPPDENNAVVCDPWPRQAEAVLVRDFLVRFGIRGFRNIRYQATSSGGDLMAQARATVDIQTAENRMKEERGPISAAETAWRFGTPGTHGTYQHDSTRL
jgi:hypothetical protein